MVRKFNNITTISSNNTKSSHLHCFSFLNLLQHLFNRGRRHSLQPFQLLIKELYLFNKGLLSRLLGVEAESKVTNYRLEDFIVKGAKQLSRGRLG